jgi:hypothetical protein
MVLGQALGRRALMDLLYVLAPYKAHGPDRFARVLDNWGIYDRAADQGASNNLFLQHVKGLGANWHEFAKHRELYMAVFKDQSEATTTVPTLAWEKTATGSRRWRLQQIEAATVAALKGSAPVLATAAATPPHLDTLLGLVAIPYFLPELCKNWPAWRPLVKDGKSNYIGPASVPMMALLHKRALLNSPLVAGTERIVDSP